MSTMNTKELIEQWPLFSEQDRTDLLSAIATRGKFKDYLLANAPAQDKAVKWAAWNALVGNLAPSRLSIAGLMFGPGRDRYTELDKLTDSRLFRACLNAVEPAFRWNLWAHNHHRQAALDRLPAVLEEMDKQLSAKAQ